MNKKEREKEAGKKQLEDYKLIIYDIEKIPIYKRTTRQKELLEYAKKRLNKKTIVRLNKDNPIGFRLTADNKRLLKEIEEYIPTVSNRNATMNWIIKSFHEVVIVPRQSAIKQIQRDMAIFGITISDLAVKRL